MRIHLNERGGPALSDSDTAADVFKVLSVGTRITILKLLGNRTLCVNAIAKGTGITAAAASQHLRVMRAAGIVEADKHGYFVHYRINQDTMHAWKELADSLLG